jgi:hypothetical protein
VKSLLVLLSKRKQSVSLKSELIDMTQCSSGNIYTEISPVNFSMFFLRGTRITTDIARSRRNAKRRRFNAAERLRSVGVSRNDDVDAHVDIEEVNVERDEVSSDQVPQLLLHF